MRMHPTIKAWMKYRAKNYAQRNWFRTVNRMSDGQTATAEVAKIYEAGVKFGMELAEMEFHHRSTGEEIPEPPK